MTEKTRRHSRYTVEGASVNAKTIFNSEVEIIDISTTGASISCAERLNIGGEYLFKFGHKDKIITVKGEVVWAKLTGIRKVAEVESAPIYTFGIQFKDAEAKAEDLTGFVADEIGAVRERRLNGIRVKIHEPERSVVTHIGSCKVTEISLGGVRIEMEETPPEGTMLTMELFVSEHEKSIECSGRIAFVKAISGGPPDRYSVGIEFIYIYDDDKARLKRFIKALPTKK